MERIRTAILWSFWPLALAGMVLIAGNPATGQDPGDAAATEAGLSELTRGPVHEAFAEPVVFNPKPGLIVKKEPPKPIEELPPEQKPEGENVAFIAGYFSFDEDKDDFFYVSGIWRQVPPGKEWVGGYWNQVDTGWQWVSGHWKSANEVVAEAPVKEGGPAKNQVEYYPEPPPSLENGANVEAPTADHVWVPGCHVWYSNRYVWRGGYWVVARPDWLWVPAHYVWSPCGYVFVEGYWDYAVARRGVIFAPCYFSAAVYLRPRFVYCPRLVIDTDICFDHFFCRPAYCHYYFGDYYATSYVSIGISPWFSFHYGRGHYCPIYSHYRWTYARNDTRWEVELRSNYRHRVDHVDYRPARTYVQQTTVINNITVNKNVNVTNVNVNKMSMAKPLTQVAANSAKPGAGSPMKFEKVTQADRQVLATKATDVRRASTERSTLETKAAKDLKVAGATGTGNTGIAKPVTLNIPKSTVVSKPTEQLTKSHAPPPVPAGGIIKAKKTDDNTAGKPGTGGSTGPVVGGGKPGDTTKTGGSGAGATGNKPTGTGGTSGAGTGAGAGGAGAGTGAGGNKPTGTGGTSGAGTGAGSGGAGAGTGAGGNKPTGTGGTSGAGTGAGSGGAGAGTGAGGNKPTGTGGTSGAGTGAGAGGAGAGTGAGGNKPTGTGGTGTGGGKPPPSGGSGAGSPPTGGAGSGMPPTGGGKPPTTGGSSGGSKPPTGGSKPPTGGSSKEKEKGKDR